MLEPIEKTKEVQDTQRKHAEQDLLRRNAQLRTLNEVGQALSHLAQPDEICELITEMVGRVLDNRNYLIALYDEYKHELSFPITIIDGQRMEPRTRRFANGITEYIVRTKQPLLIRSDLVATVKKLGIRLTRNPPPRTVLAVPMIVGERVIGVISLNSFEKEGTLGEEHLELLSIFANQAAIALANAQLYDETRRRAIELEQAYDTLKENQRKLLIAEKMASLGRLTAGIAHEMNTPLATVRAALFEMEKLVQEYQDSIGNGQVTASDHYEIAREMRQSLSLANTAAERAASFVKGIRTQTRDRAEGQRPFNPAPVIQETLLLLDHALRMANCTASLLAPDSPLELRGSPGKLAQVVTNLVTNAIDASIPKGGGPLKLVLETQSSGVRLTVADYGCGIAPEHLSLIFDPMFTTKPFGEGTGLGLTIVHDIVVGEFGGTVEVTSQLGRGTTFDLFFPSVREAPLAPAPR